MTPLRNPPASRTEPLVGDEELLDGESRRAWTEAMSVRPFGDSYLVDCEDGTHFVTLGESNCSCGATDGDERCKHLRRVAIEINLGRVPPPSTRTVDCQGCGSDVAVSVADGTPFLCRGCRFEPGDLVVDEAGNGQTPLLVVSGPGRPANEVSVPGVEGTVADHPENDRYPADSPVVEAIYPQSVSVDRPPRRYLFPVARLSRPSSAPEQASLERVTATDA